MPKLYKMAHKLEKKWKNEVSGKKHIELEDKNPNLWKPLKKMKDFFFMQQHFLKEQQKNLPKQKKK